MARTQTLIHGVRGGGGGGGYSTRISGTVSQSDVARSLVPSMGQVNIDAVLQPFSSF